jgi:hypothetical protein
MRSGFVRDAFDPGPFEVKTARGPAGGVAVTEEMNDGRPDGPGTC